MSVLNVHCSLSFFLFRKRFLEEDALWAVSCFYFRAIHTILRPNADVANAVSCFRFRAIHTQLRLGDPVVEAVSCFHFRVIHTLQLMDILEILLYLAFILGSFTPEHLPLIIVRRTVSCFHFGTIHTFHSQFFLLYLAFVLGPFTPWQLAFELIFRCILLSF